MLIYTLLCYVTCRAATTFVGSLFCFVFFTLLYFEIKN